MEVEKQRQEASKRTVAEEKLMDSEWEFQHPTGKFNVEFRADGYNHCARDARRCQRGYDRQHKKAEVERRVRRALAGQRQGRPHAPHKKRVDHADHGEDGQAQHRRQRDGGDLFVERSARRLEGCREARGLLWICGVVARFG